MSQRFREIIGAHFGARGEGVVPPEDITQWWMNLSSDARSELLGTTCLDKSLADQSQADEADINSIVRRFHLTGIAPVRADAAMANEMKSDLEMMEGASNFDLQSGLNRVNEARFVFDSLPLHVRKRFGFDPLEFSTALLDPEKGPKIAHELGLTVVVPEDKIPRVEIANIGDLMKKESIDERLGKGVGPAAPAAG